MAEAGGCVILGKSAVSLSATATESSLAISVAIYFAATGLRDRASAPSVDAVEKPAIAPSVGAEKK
jgi:hypothetical protein